jgi:hypothetical protein
MFKNIAVKFYCQNTGCYKEVKKDDNFCSNCGVQLDTEGFKLKEDEMPYAVGYSFGGAFETSTRGISPKFLTKLN